MASTLSKTHVRWIFTNDIPDLVELEKLCFTEPWDQDDFQKCLKKKNINGMVVESGRRVVAFLLFEIQRKKAQLLNLAVHPSHRNQGLATKLVDTCLSYLHSNNCQRVVADVRETNLAAQLFLRTVNFRAHILSRFYEDNEEDAYRFECWLD